jgi:hypothetical protein
LVAFFAAGFAAVVRFTAGFVAFFAAGFAAVRFAAGFAAVVRFAAGFVAFLAAGFAAVVRFTAGFVVFFAAGFAAVVRFTAGFVAFFAAGFAAFAAGFAVAFRAVVRVVATGCPRSPSDVHQSLRTTSSADHLSAGHQHRSHFRYVAQLTSTFFMRTRTCAHASMHVARPRSAHARSSNQGALMHRANRSRRAASRASRVATMRA